ncbi:3-Oxoacyl-[acyl-carrier-(ACP)] synthase III family protein [Kosakonia radicincitans YD4]|nr:3-Oxoacyl-[acyl-carrier-(ACP)] synthase III family protein [Kosakonia radicincitans YD4]
MSNHPKYTCSPGHTRLISTGVYLPEGRISSRELMEQLDSPQRFGLNRNWLARLTGVRERCVAADHLQPSDLAVRAAHDALARAEIKLTDIDALIFAGVFRDFHEPATAHIVAHKLGANIPTAFDVSNACHSFEDALHIMDALIAAGQVKYGLIVTGETSYRMRHEAINRLQQTTDRELFMELCAGLNVGDCGAAMIVGAKKDPHLGFMGFMKESRSHYYHYSTSGPACSDHLLKVWMTPLVDEAISMGEAMFPAFMDTLGWSRNEIKACVSHQASTSQIQRMAGYMDVDPALFVETISTMGNLISGNATVGLHILAERQQLKPGDKLVLVGGGSGIVGSHMGLIWG